VPPWAAGGFLAPCATEVFAEAIAAHPSSAGAHCATSVASLGHHRNQGQCRASVFWHAADGAAVTQCPDDKVLEHCTGETVIERGEGEAVQGPDDANAKSPSSQWSSQDPGMVDTQRMGGT